jgi:HlyD family secretion protein
MKLLKVITSILVICGVIFLSFSCSSKTTATATTTTRSATVQKGNISISITGTGNLAYSTTENLAFEVPGYVESVAVKAGDTVTEGQEIAKVDTSEWDTKLKSYQAALTKAQRALVSAQDTLAAKQREVASKELAVKQTQLDINTAEYNLVQIADVKTAQAAVDSAESTLALVKSNLQLGLASGSANTDALLKQVSEYQAILDQAKQRLQSVLSGKNINITSTVALQISQYQLKIEQAQKAVEDAQVAVNTANTAVKNAELDIIEAEQAVQDALDTLDKAKSLSPIVTAPFAGIITSVNVKGGDEVFKGSIAATIADPAQFQADISVVENDIYSVKIGGEAVVSLDALSDLTFPAKVTYIAPTASVSSGVVSYSVTVTLTSLQPITTTANTSGQISAQPAAGTLPSGIPPATTSQSNTGAASASTTSSSSATITLKKGLSASVKIISEQASGVLIIPAKAIKQQGPNSTVQVVKGVTTETVIVKTGITDGTNTEITAGLSAGQQITYTLTTATSSSSSSSGRSTTQQAIQGISGGGTSGPPPGGF